MIFDALHKEKLLQGVMVFLLCILLICGCSKESETVNTGNISQAAEDTPDIGDDGSRDGENGTEMPEKGEQEISSPSPEVETWDRPKVKGIFVTGAMAGTDNMENLIDLVDQTELNALVIDVKNDEGRVTFDMDVPSVQEMGVCIRYIRDIQDLMEKCKEKNIYLIARIVAFKDPYMEQVKPEWCIHNADGSLFKDKNGMTWLDPHNEQVWAYLLEVAQGALDIGFDEIQFDYMRFSTDPNMESVDFGQQDEDRRKVITEFVKYASERIHAVGGAVSADVYGVVIDSDGDQRIVGQDYLELSRYLDYISPMVYPSHYGPYNYNIPVPDAEPYRLVLTALLSSRKVLAGVPVNEKKENPGSENGMSGNTISGNTVSEYGQEKEEEIPEIEYSTEKLASLEPLEGVRVRVRPWLQAFTATWVKGHILYEGDEIREQIQAVYDAGYEEWILWNASNKYTDEGLMKEE